MKRLTIKTSKHLKLLSNYIKFYWHIEVHCSNNEFIKQLVLPSLHTDLIFILQESLNVNGNQINQPFISPVLVKWKELELKAGTVLFGIRLNPIHFHHFSGLHLNTLDQDPNPMKYVFNDRIYQKLERRVFGEEKFEARVKMLDSYFSKFNLSTIYPDNLLYEIFAHIQKTPDVKVKDITSISGYSERWLQKAFKMKIGVNPGKIIQIARFNRFLAILTKSPNINLSKVSYEAGYSDQSHLVRDVKKFSSHTPKFYMERLSRFIQIMNS